MRVITIVPYSDVMLFLYLIIAAVLLSTYRRPIAVFVPGLLPYFTYLSFLGGLSLHLNHLIA